MELFLGWIVFSSVVGVVAAQRGRSGWGFFFLSLLLSPVLGLIIVVATPNQAQEQARAKERDEDRQWRRDLTNAAQPADKFDLADEIVRLAALKEQGLLSSDEFVAAKAKLLSADNRVNTAASPRVLMTFEDCEAVLRPRGYRVARRADGTFDVREPLGGIARLVDLPQLIGYSTQRRSKPLL